MNVPGALIARRILLRAPLHVVNAAIATKCRLSEMQTGRLSAMQCLFVRALASMLGLASTGRQATVSQATRSPHRAYSSRLLAEFQVGTGRSGSWSHNAAGRNAGDLVGATILRGQCVAIGAGGATYDAALVVSSVGGSFLPRSLIGHWAFDGEYATVVVGDNEVERLAGVISTRHRLMESVAEGSSEVIRLA